MNSKYYDPYDIWSTERLGRLKSAYTQGAFTAKILMLFVGVIELLAPLRLRQILQIKKHQFAHVEAMKLSYEPKNTPLSFFSSTAINCHQGLAWGLPFKWFSKNGVYHANTPYITNTPYIMEVLLAWQGAEDEQRQAKKIFYATWFFLESLKVLHHSEKQLALSYAPIDEPRMVINANSYAAFAYALHVRYGKAENSQDASRKVLQLIHWIIAQQQKEGAWYYYADNETGNFIDCFHSCFVIKNLLKVKHLLCLEQPELSTIIDPAIQKGWAYIQTHFYDKKTGLCRRFIDKNNKDPFRWDLYDQAEYLGLLVDFNCLDVAQQFVQHIEKTFKIKDDWYCRIDIMGRHWGKNFMRWGIVPFLHHKSRMDAKRLKRDSLCVE